MEHQGAAPHGEHPPTTIRQYVLIGLFLTVITVIELWLSYSGLPDGPLITALIVLSALKFVIVVAMFMHLRFDHPLLTQLFVIGLVLATSLLLALIALFWNSESDIVGGIPEGAEGAHAEQQAGGGSGGEAAATEQTSEDTEPASEESEPAGDPAEGVVQGQPVGEFFQTNCAACHGPNREGLVGPALTPDALTESDDFYFDTIKNGRPGTAMPAWGQQGLTDADITALVQFIKNVAP